MNCRETLNAVGTGADDAEVRSHLRACASCLESAVALDPDFLFRSLGGAETEPPGGLDAFVGEVLEQVRIRETEKTLRPRAARISPFTRWSVAATIAMGLLIGTIVSLQGPAPAVPEIAPASSTPVAAIAALDRPVIESYDSAGAMIVEIPAEETSDIRLVMVFDESLPADL